jgi:hypothetical protein
MKPLITNANSRSLDQISPTLPQMNLTSWFQTITFTVVRKAIVNFETIETQTKVVFQGIVETVDPTKLTVLPVGERQWNMISVWTSTDLELSPDDLFYYNNAPNRVMQKYDWQPYGYIQYECSEDFKK